MALPSFISGKREEEFFVSFVVGKNWIQAGVWNVQDNKGTLVSAGTTSPWHEDPPTGGPDSFVEAADDSLSSALGALSEQSKLEKVIFGLPTQWIDSGKVRQDRLILLKKLCDTLELKPSGFVVIPEALVFALRQKEEGAGVSFILVGLVEDEIEITNVRGGKIVDVTTVARSISLGDDLAEGLARFGTNNLPARIILYNRHIAELNEIKNELSGWEWPLSHFNHTPRIETLPPDFVITAVSEAGAVEIAHVTKFMEEAEEEQTEAGKKVERVEEMEQGEQKTSEVEPEIQSEKIPSTRETPEDIELHPARPSRKFPTIHIPNPLQLIPSFGGGKIRGFLILFILLFLFGIAAFVFLPRAEVTIYLSPQKLEDKLDVVVSRTGEQNGKLPGRVISGELTGEKTKRTSGRKIVGERAKGEVVIFNNTSSSRSFASGTILTGPSGLKFVLDSVVNVASESGAPTYKPGEAKGSLTAGDIGAEYNLAPGNIFSIANFSTSSFSARNDVSLTGGSSREVASVVKEDQDTLEDDLKEELEERALSELKAQLGPSEILIPESTRTAVASRSFSAKPGDETETLNLRLTVRTDLIAVDKDDLESYIMSAVANKIPQGFVLQSGHISVVFTPKEGDEEGNSKQFALDITALLLPDLNRKELVNKVSGKTTNEAQKQLSNLPGFVRSTIKLSPSLPGPFYRLPIKSDNITLEILPER